MVAETSGHVSIGGAKILARWASRGIAKVKRESDAFKFTKGRSLSLSSVSIISKPCDLGLLALYWKDIFLGVGKLTRSKIINILDTGEFLRRGY